MKLATKLTRAAEEIDMITRLGDWGSSVKVRIHEREWTNQETVYFLGDLYGREAVEWISGKHAVMALLFAAEVARRP